MFESTERQALYRDITSTAQQLRLLSDVLEAVTGMSDMREVLLRVEDGIKKVLPTTWGSVRMVLRDENPTMVQVHQFSGAGISRYWSNVRAGALAASQGLDVQLEYVAGAASGDGSQAAALRAAIADRVDAIGVAPIDAQALEPLVREAIALGIPVLAFDTPAAEDSQVWGYVGTDNQAAGRLAGEVLRRIIPENGIVGVSLDSLSAVNGAQRIAGLRAAFAGTAVTILPPVEERYDPVFGAQLVANLVASHAELHGALAATGGSGPSWAKAIERSRRTDLPIVCFDVSADSIWMLKHGSACAIVAQRESDMGYRTVELLCRAVVEGRAALQRLLTNNVFDTGVDLITLDRTEWSTCLADSLTDTLLHHQADPQLRALIGRRPRRPIIRVIGMAEQGDSGLTQSLERLDPATLVGQVISDATSRVLDPAIDPGTSPDLLDARRRNIRTLTLVPLVARGHALGAFVLESDTEGACSPSDLAMLERVSSAVAAAVENVRLVTQLERRAAELQQISRQQEGLIQTIMEISSLAVPIVRGVLILPLVGVIDSQRAGAFMETLMTEVGRRHAAIVLVDITGVSVVDTGVANHLIQAARAVRLLGAEVVLVGISPAVAQTIVQLGVDLTGIVTRADLENGFAYALSRVNAKIVYQAA